MLFKVIRIPWKFFHRPNACISNTSSYPQAVPSKIHCLALPTPGLTLADLYPLSLVGSRCCTWLLRGNLGTSKTHPTKPTWYLFLS